MNKEEFKEVFADYAKSMIDKWFDSKNINDTLCKALGYTIIDANINKYDSYLEYLCDAGGNVCVADFIDNLVDCYIPYQIDLTRYDMPFLPNKILLIGKNDIQLLKEMCMEKMKMQTAEETDTYIEEYSDSCEEHSKKTYY